MRQVHLPNHHRYIDRLPGTPLVGVSLKENSSLIWCKLEFLNPSGSIKDRIARYILEKAWRQGKIQEGSWVAEASSGSTSIALALACAQMNLKFFTVMPKSVSRERVLMIRAFGGEVIFSEAEEGILGAMILVEKEAKKRKAFLTRQFENMDNAEAHHLWTGQEILSQIPGGSVDAVVSGVGTGGTILGLTTAFKEAGCDLQSFVAKPTTSEIIGGFECSSFSGRIPGIVEGLSKLYTPKSMPDAIEIEVGDTLAIQTTRKLISMGFPVGPSSGLNFAAAELAANKLGKEAQIVTVFPDRMERYFSTDLFSTFS
jgi:cysteine synthase A